MPEKTCSTCQCNKVCDHNKYGFENCGNYISADVAPRAEAEKWFREFEELQGRMIELEKEAAFWEREADNAVAIAEGNIRAEIASGGTSCHWCENKIKADTVRKMQKMLKEKAVDVDMDDATLWMSCVPIDDIDQIAKQLTEDKA